MFANLKSYSKLYQRDQRDDDDSSLTLKNEDDDLLPAGGHVRSLECAYILLTIILAITCAVFGYVAHPNAITSCPTPTHTDHVDHAGHTDHADHSHHMEHTAHTEAPPKPAKTELHCGNSSAEARSLGCVFDLLTNNWMPKSCADPYTDAEYREWVMDPSRDMGAWAFYHDDKAVQQIPSEDALSDLVGHHIYTTTENHLAHCVFLARRMHRLVTGEIAAVAHNTFSHTMHCTSALLKDMGKDANRSVKAEIGSTFDVGIVSCVLDEHAHAYTESEA
ncbi:hypothetical protein NKR19_g6942 [Coniochaeta hoffmannii]|uniref:Uncharacterized protein n=1 Tax=Coniochaeta hoffmannii TaxID=91930 RepID=A0AA38VNW0_9PEZI|nr:hypothetical protein NKR19_g6942 [Coniochaeta hoffmannii]